MSVLHDELSKRTSGELPADYDGAGAFELVLQGGEWREEEPASGAAAA